MWKTKEPVEPASTVYRVHVDNPLVVESLARTLRAFLREKVSCQPARLTILCIGTDRSTGDCLGPLVGSRLIASNLPSNVTVLGTLDDPVHATNLEEYMKRIEQEMPYSYVLALDACLGKAENVGYISLKDGPLRPGSGVNKKLMEIGDAHLVGVVNVGGFMEYFVLQNTRLSLIMRMATAMSEGILGALEQYRNVCRPGINRNQLFVPETAVSELP